MENKGFLFIPDISGFTRFVNETEISHSRMIIQELLEMLINANQSGLQISEIEGDAILFYRFGERPDLQEIYSQVQTMFCNFHKHLASYDNRRYCFCKACNAASELTLKIVTHYGEFTGYRVQQFEKLFGKDIIVAHQLLKNNIKEHEYWLVTDSVVAGSPPAKIEDWMSWDSSVQKTESGEVPFHYTYLGPLRKVIPPQEEPADPLKGRTPVISLIQEFHRDIVTVFHAAGDFNHRHLWQDGVLKVEEVSHFLPRVGMKYRKVTAEGSTIVYSVGYAVRESALEFMEQEENNPWSMHYLLEKIDDEKTRLTWTCYIRSGIWNKLSFDLFRKKNVRDSMEKSLEKLTPLVNTFEAAEIRM